MKVLVTYATRHGATQGIADRIARTLERDGLEVALRPVERAGSVDAYDAVVIGAAAYMFHWMKEASAFVRKHRAVLAARPVWLFSSGPIGTELVDAKGHDVLEASRPKEFDELAAEIRPRDQRIFFGAYDPDAAPVGIAEILARKLPATIRDQMPRGDYRDWPAIEAWAHGIARDLQPVEVA